MTPADTARLILMWPALVPYEVLVINPPLDLGPGDMALLHLTSTPMVVASAEEQGRVEAGVRDRWIQVLQRTFHHYPDLELRADGLHRHRMDVALWN